MSQPFIFRPDRGEQSRAYRGIVEALANSQAPRNIGEGLSALGDGIAARKARIGAFPTAPGGSPFSQMARNLLGLNFPGKGGLW
jgi:hypothetical protein